MQSLIKIQVIDEKLLVDGLHKNGGIISKNDTEISEYSQEKSDTGDLIEVIPNATTLILSFKKINKIENLVGFNNLVKLCLDNNQIEKIANLSVLIHLKWLDLSFNEISAIEGLEYLTSLEDLSLFSNKIKEINHNLDANINLKCLSIGNNLIDNYQTIIPLRQLKNLKMLTLAGNPICSNNTDHKKHIFAYFENVKFVDYLLVDTQERAQAKELFAEELQLLYDQDNVLQGELTMHNSIMARKRELDLAGILFSFTIFEDVFNSDQYINKLRHLPGMPEQISKFQEIISNVTNGFAAQSIEKNNVRLTDSSNFNGNKKKLLSQYELDTGKLSNDVESAKSFLSEYLNKKSLQTRHIAWPEWEKLVSNLVDQYEKLIDELMSYELKLVENFDVLIDEYDDRLNEYKLIILDCQNTYFRSLEENEKNFSSYIKSMSLDLIERVAREDFLDDAESDKIDEEAFSLLMDRDICMQCIGSCQELHISKILKLEDLVRNNVIKSTIEEIATAKTEQHLRNRNRVLEIRNYSKTCKSQIDVFLSIEDDDDIFNE